VPVSKFVGVLIVGILVGTAIGYVFTPRPVSTPTPVSPAESISFVYTVFNTQTETVKSLSRDYTKFSVTTDYEVAFNATTPADIEPLPKAIIKMRNATSVPLCGLDIALFKTNIIDVNYVNESDSNSTIKGHGTYHTGMIVQVLYDGAHWTVRDYNNASNIFATFPCPNFTLRAIEASGENDSTTAGYATVDVDNVSVPVSVNAAHYLLDYTYNSTMGLCSEVRGKSGNSLNYSGQVFWICSDNLLAYYALKQYDENVSNTIGDTLRIYANMSIYKLPKDSAGLPISYKHEAIVPGDVLPLWMPCNPGNNTNGLYHYYKLKNGSSYVIGTEVNNGTLWTTWVNYADEWTWQGLSFVNQNRTAEALACYHSMMSLWDGYGFADAAYNDVNASQHGHYEPFKLALGIILRQRLHLPKPSQESTMDDILAHCQGSDGGIATGYDKNWSTAGHNENTETTALVVIANVYSDASATISPSVPEFPSIMIPPLLVMITLFGVVVFKRKRNEMT
jgi:hypothetical protein